MNFFLLCAYNEQENISQVISSIYEKFCDDVEIVVVDDGSTDGTRDVLEKIKIGNKKLTTIYNKKNLGLGCALKIGFDYLAKISGYKDVIITLDADNTHPVEVAQEMIKKIVDNNDIVIASRYEKGGGQIGVNIIRKIISFLGKIFLKIFFNFSNVKDYTSGYRAYKSEIIKRAKGFYGDNFIKENDFVVQLEILYKLSKLSPKITEVPLILRYDKKYGKSKLKIVKNIFKYLYFIIKNKFI